MKRVLTCLLILMALVLTQTVASAHTLSLVAVVTVGGADVTAQFQDLYGVSVPGGDTKAALQAPGGKPGKSVQLAEGPPGIYRGALPAPGTAPYLLVLDFTVADQLFRVQIPVEPGKPVSEVRIPTTPIDPAQRVAWEPWAYGTAVVLMFAATGIAWLRQRRAGDPDEEE